MKNLQNIEAEYNAHVDVFDQAYAANEDYAAEYEKGYLAGVEHVLQQLGVNYRIDTFGFITIERN